MSELRSLVRSNLVIQIAKLIPYNELANGCYVTPVWHFVSVMGSKTDFLRTSRPIDYQVFFLYSAQGGFV